MWCMSNLIGGDSIQAACFTFLKIWWGRDFAGHSLKLNALGGTSHQSIASQPHLRSIYFDVILHFVHYLNSRRAREKISFH